MADTLRPEPLFIADAPALDFLNSVAAPWGTEIEWLAGGLDLLDWLERAGFISAEVLADFREKASPEALDEVADQARELREWFRRFIAAHAGGRLEPSALPDLDKINRLLVRDEAYRQIEAREIHAAHEDQDGTHLPLQWWRGRRWRGPEDLLLPIADAMGEFICGADFERVKSCEGPTCTMWFQDVSKNHTRRWCAMAVCGNRAKAAAHRAKKRSADVVRLKRAESD
ncbi:MAG: CGNR zinc finger domain-containing protein [Rhodospirillales bacterium]|nr:CGNR zinc finger domain-containing protein [Rhodospirillales bacterium]